MSRFQVVAISYLLLGCITVTVCAQTRRERVFVGSPVWVSEDEFVVSLTEDSKNHLYVLYVGKDGVVVRTKSLVPKNVLPIAPLPKERRVTVMQRGHPAKMGLFDLKTLHLSWLPISGANPKPESQGKLIAFVNTDTDKDGLNIYVWDSQRRKERKVTQDLSVREFLWAPRRSEIAFISVGIGVDEMSGVFAVGVASSDGSPQRVLVADLLPKTGLGWSHDGQRIFFCVWNSERKEFEVRSVRVDTGQQTVVATSVPVGYKYARVRRTWRDPYLIFQSGPTRVTRLNIEQEKSESINFAEEFKRWEPSPSGLLCAVITSLGPELLVGNWETGEVIRASSLNQER
ncbi:MAG: hypothetical protein GTN69_05805 [Armatimonadetes bacterium]|nr:hypothetical protein [candidate division Zixibacteria bacterium]NIO75391.1 hypothetical protein [Armatimonadota bacterium]